MKQYWFADDGSGAGSVTEIMTRWDTLSTLSPDFGYFLNDRKCWIITKPAKEESVREAFKDTYVTGHVCNSTRAETPWGGDRFKGVFRGICQRKGDQLDQ